MTDSTELLIAGATKPMKMFSYQPVFIVRNDERYLKSVNIIHDRKILKKIYLDNQIPLSVQENIDSIIVKTLIDYIVEVTREKPISKKQEKSSQTTKTKNARAEAAKDLFENLNLKY